MKGPLHADRINQLALLIPRSVQCRLAILYRYLAVLRVVSRRRLLAAPPKLPKAKDTLYLNQKNRDRASRMRWHEAHYLVFFHDISFYFWFVMMMWNQSTLDCVQDKHGGRTVGYLPDTLLNVRNAFSWLRECNEYFMLYFSWVIFSIAVIGNAKHYGKIIMFNNRFWLFTTICPGQTCWTGNSTLIKWQVWDPGLKLQMSLGFVYTWGIYITLSCGYHRPQIVFP